MLRGPGIGAVADKELKEPRIPGRQLCPYDVRPDEEPGLLAACTGCSTSGRRRSPHIH